jgi:hypothetical protein
MINYVNHINTRSNGEGSRRIFHIQGVPKKMSPIIFCGTTSLPVIEYSIFKIFFINEHITLIVAFFAPKYLTVRLLELLKGGDTNIATCPNCGY